MTGSRPDEVDLRQCLFLVCTRALTLQMALADLLRTLGKSDGGVGFARTREYRSDRTVRRRQPSRRLGIPYVGQRDRAAWGEPRRQWALNGA